MNLYDLALCIVNNDNDATRATNKLYALQKSCDCPINTTSILVTCEHFPVKETEK